MWILALADDLTGALEAGAKFASSVVTTRRLLSHQPAAPVLVIDTETRHLPPHEAAAIVLETARSARRFAPHLIYKKTDSTLRGNIAAEFRALLTAFPERPLIYAPAYPAMGRTVKDRHLFVHGIPVHQTAFAADPLNPVRGSNIAELLGDLSATVLDGESTLDIEVAAREIVAKNPPPLAAGPAALAGALALSLQQEADVMPTLPRFSRCLIVNGSLHPASTAQIDFACLHRFLDDDWICCDRHPETVRRALAQSHFDALIVFGGDTAFDIHRTLHAPDFHSYGEVVPGVPLSRCGDLFWITKAGGFGPPELLCDIRRRLTS